MNDQIEYSKDIAKENSPSEGFVKFPIFEGRPLQSDFVHLSNGYIDAFINKYYDYYSITPVKEGSTCADKVAVDTWEDVLTFFS